MRANPASGNPFRDLNIDRLTGAGGGFWIALIEFKLKKERAVEFRGLASIKYFQLESGFPEDCLRGLFRVSDC
ncbi:hypothetical protein BV898_09185 [Hypsibius exemplaris]|uniref:Uncharacterized protein n=1 Tax=Hypsibius exemplaris TaxID=2072580 RepID=A0A1W0WN81_HYPEX|nr:hypothetical protein BV898_09185 [Hypsibius exemplaris]